MPGLLTLKTDLKSLKYGQDTPGGGDSGQPYIKTDINTVDRGFNRFRLTRFDDGLVRGGVIGALNASVVDTLRISKFLVDLPKGPLFIAKQVGLQLSNPRLESKQVRTDRATSGGGFINNSINFLANVAGKIENAVGPTRIYNLGINTLAQVPVNALGGHIVRHGFLPVRDESKDYINVVKENNFVNNTNRLERLTGKFYLGRQAVVQQRTQVTNATLAAFGAITSPILGVSAGLAINKNQFSIDNYIGGPDSVYGLVSTNIRRFDYTQDLVKINFAISQSKDFAGYTRDDKNQHSTVKIKNTVDYKISSITSSSFATSSFNLSSTQLDNSFIYNVASDKDKTNPTKAIIPINYYNTTQTSKLLFTGSQNFLDNTKIDPNNPTNKPSFLDLRSISPTAKVPITISPSDIANYTTTPIAKKPTPGNYSTYQKIIDSRLLQERTYTFNGVPVNQFGVYGQIGQLTRDLGTNILPTSTNPIIYKNGYDEVIQINTKFSWNNITREIRVGSGRQDEINLTPIFDGINYYGEDVTPNGKKIRDLVKFRIQAVNTDGPENGQWMVFRAYLTDLSDDTTPDWTDVKYAGRGDKFYIYNGFTRKINIGFKVAALSEKEMKFIYQKLNFLMGNAMPDYSGVLMRGPLVRMTVGNWIDCQLGKIDSISFKVPQDSPWEIALDEPEGGTKQLILPHIVEVTLGFTPIGSETRRNNLIPKKSTTTSHIAQNNTGDVGFQYIE